MERKERLEKLEEAYQRYYEMAHKRDMECDSCLAPATKDRFNRLILTYQHFWDAWIETNTITKGDVLKLIVKNEFKRGYELGLKEKL
jgi:hypothetical protein